MMIRNVFADEMGDEFTEFFTSRYMTLDAMENLINNPQMSWVDDVNTKGKKENIDDIIAKSFHNTIDTLMATLGDNVEKWQWGRVHSLTIGHPLGKVKILDRIFNFNLGPFPVGGSIQTVSPYAYRFSAPFKTTNGASHRHIYTTSNWDKSLTIMPTGNSGIPKSKYYDDQTGLYLRNIYHADYFSKDSVVKYAKFKMRFTK